MKTLTEFINNTVNESSDILSQVKKGDTIVLIVERDNPQLGTYVNIRKRTVSRVTPTTILVDDFGMNKSFDKETGRERKSRQNIYGSTVEYIMTVEEYEQKIKQMDKGKWYGNRITANDFDR